LALARRLEDSALRDDVLPHDGSRLARLVLEFNRNLIRGIGNVIT
jgi:hypothetical protein